MLIIVSLWPAKMDWSTRFPSRSVAAKVPSTALDSGDAGEDGMADAADCGDFVLAGVFSAWEQAAVKSRTARRMKTMLVFCFIVRLPSVIFIITVYVVIISDTVCNVKKIIKIVAKFDPVSDQISPLITYSKLAYNQLFKHRCFLQLYNWFFSVCSFLSIISQDFQETIKVFS